MTQNPITVTTTTNIAEVGAIFEEHNIHHIPVVHGDALEGIVSKSDFLFFKNGFSKDAEDAKFQEARLYNYDVSSIMTKGIAKMHPDDKIIIALDLFEINSFHAIPVVVDNKVVGIVTTHDIVKQLIKDNPK